jgi:hypothetical protein
MPSDSLANRDTWGEWHYFNVVSEGGKRWAFISFIVGGDVTGTEWAGNLGITLREEGGPTRRFASKVDRSRVRFSTSDANLVFGDSRVTVLPNGDYRVLASAKEEGGSSAIDVDMTVTPAPYAYFPGVSMGAGDFVSGYTVPGLRAAATGTLCVDRACEKLTAAQAYHDHNWGVWKGVTWEWGAARAGQFTFLYGRVHSPDSTASVPPILVYLIDSLGFRGVFRPRSISYENGRTTRVGARNIASPSRAVLFDERGGDTLRIELTIEDAIGTDTRSQRQEVIGAASDTGDVSLSYRTPYFLQMKGTARISGTLDGAPISGHGAGFFETFR